MLFVSPTNIYLTSLILLLSQLLMFGFAFFILIAVSAYVANLAGMSHNILHTSAEYSHASSSFLDTESNYIYKHNWDCGKRGAAYLRASSDKDWTDGGLARGPVSLYWRWERSNGNDCRLWKRKVSSASNWMGRRNQVSTNCITSCTC